MLHHFLASQHYVHGAVLKMITWHYVYCSVMLCRMSPTCYLNIFM